MTKGLCVSHSSIETVNICTQKKREEMSLFILTEASPNALKETNSPPHALADISEPHAWGGYRHTRSVS